MEGPEALSGATSWNFRDEQLAKVYERYVEMLKESDAARLRRPAAQRWSCSTSAEHVRGATPRSSSYILVDEYQDTNRPQYLLVQQLAVGAPQRLRRRRPGPVDLQLARRGCAEHPRLRARLSRARDRAARAELPLDADDPRRRVRGDRQNRQRKDKTLWTERSGGETIVYTRTHDELEEADFVLRTSATARRRLDDLAVLYRTNAQSRALEEALPREGIPYRIVGGVQFYERKEVKDVLAYLKLIINPHDDVSFRRVVNVPARGIGKIVMDALDAADPTTAGDGCAAAHGRRPVDADVARRSLWARRGTCSTTSAPSRAGARVAQGVREIITGEQALVEGQPSPEHRAGDGQLRLLQGPARGERRRKPPIASRTWPSSSPPHASSSRASWKPPSAPSSIVCRSCPRPTRAPARRTPASG